MQYPIFHKIGSSTVLELLNIFLKQINSIPKEYYITVSKNIKATNRRDLFTIDAVNDKQIAKGITGQLIREKNYIQFTSMLSFVTLLLLNKMPNFLTLLPSTMMPYFLVVSKL